MSDTEQPKEFEPTDHFAPDYHDCPDLSMEVENRLGLNGVAYKRGPRDNHFPAGNPPFENIATSWEWPDLRGAYTKEIFDKHIVAALDSFAGLLKSKAEDYDGPLIFYPITVKPATSYGIAYHDFGGPTTPLDIRFIIAYANDILVTYEGQEEPEAATGLKFHVNTLIRKPGR